jgi:hypothetical protein
VVKVKVVVILKNDLLVSKDPAAHLWIQEHPRAEAKLTDGNCQWEISGAWPESNLSSSV